MAALSPLALEALHLLARCPKKSVNAAGLSKLACEGTEGSEWRRTSEFHPALEELQLAGLVGPGRYVHAVSAINWHHDIDFARVHERLALEAIEIPPLVVSERGRPSALAG